MASNINKLQTQKLDLQIKLNELLKSNNKNEDEINALKSEILYLDKQIKKIVGTNEIELQQELKRKKTGIDQINLDNYFIFKRKYKTISNMNIATRHIISIIENSYYKEINNTNDNLVKVR